MNMAGVWLFPKEPEKPADLIVTDQNRSYQPVFKPVWFKWYAQQENISVERRWTAASRYY